MGLRQQAAADLKSILENEDDFGWPITVTNPVGVSADLVGMSTDISEVLDPGLGIPVSGRLASVAIASESLTAAGLGLPNNVSDESSKPWLVRFNDIGG